MNDFLQSFLLTSGNYLNAERRCSSEETRKLKIQTYAYPLTRPRQRSRWRTWVGFFGDCLIAGAFLGFPMPPANRNLMELNTCGKQFWCRLSRPLKNSCQRPLDRRLHRQPMVDHRRWKTKSRAINTKATQVGWQNFHHTGRKHLLRRALYSIIQARHPLLPKRMLNNVQSSAAALYENACPFRRAPLEGAEGSQLTCVQGARHSRPCFAKWQSFISALHSNEK